MAYADYAWDQLLHANTPAPAEFLQHSLKQIKFMCFKQDGTIITLRGNL